MSRSTSSRSTLTMVPSTMSPSLKYLIVLSIAARKSSLEPMSLTATCGEVTAGLGMLLGCSGQVGSEGQNGIYLSRLLDRAHAGQTRPRHTRRECNGRANFRPIFRPHVTAVAVQCA